MKRSSTTEVVRSHHAVGVSISRNIAFSLIRVFINALVTLALPAYLTHRLPVATYSAWVLILQLSAFVSFLDLGVQTGVSKFVAEHDAKGDQDAAGCYASAGLVIMMAMGVGGILLSSVLALKVPHLFQSMPADLLTQARLSILLIGYSLSANLVCSVFSAIFLGLQRYSIPMILAVLNRICFSIAVIATVSMRASLTIMAAVVAVVNLATALAQVVAWKTLAKRIRITLFSVDARVLREMIAFCFILAVWTVGMLCVSGLDVTIVGHFAYAETAPYSLATLPANFLVVVISAAIGPMMPAASALNTQKTPLDLGVLLERSTRYSTVLLLVIGLPILMYAFPILRLWVGKDYAVRTTGYLQILVAANLIRNLCLPYATMVVATGRMAAVTLAPVAEAVVNLGASLFLVRHLGAEGVAIGTVIGAIVTLSIHFIVSMHYTRSSIVVNRTKLFITGILKPMLMAVPALIVVCLWRCRVLPSGSVVFATTWAVATVFCAWRVSLNHEDRLNLKNIVWRALNGLMPILGH